MKATKEHKETISIRFPVSLLDELDEIIATGSKYDNRGHAVVNLTRKGIELEALIEISKDPEKMQQFEKQLKELQIQNNYEQTLETVDDSTLDAIISYATIIKDKRFKQSLLFLK